MKRKSIASKLIISVAWCVLALSHAANGDTHYVNVNNANPSAPYTSWVTAATNIQGAVDEAITGDTVLVTNGVYDTGSVVTPSYDCTNRVVITDDITVQSVNGSAYTFIVGAEANGGGNGSDAVRGVYMSAGVLSGFTVTNGHTMTSGSFYAIYYNTYGGGINMYEGGIATNCVLTGNSAGNHGGGSTHGSLFNCTLSGNSAEGNGGGCYGGTLNNCTLTGNSASLYGGGSYQSMLNSCTLSVNSVEGSGGGCYWGTLNNCVLSGNSAEIGGGSYAATLTNCTLSSNSARKGGGSYSGTLYNCSLMDNSAISEGGGSCRGALDSCILAGNSATDGGGSYDSTLNNCSLMANSAIEYGGGSRDGTLNNCTLTGNSADYGGGSAYGTLNNCIVYFNNASTSFDNWYHYATPDIFYSCTAPNPGGMGCITNNPMLVSGTHISTNSPCWGMGNTASLYGADIDGELWLDPPSIGCDENSGHGSVTGAITAVLLGPASTVEGYMASHIPVFIGPVTKTTVDFGNGLVLTNLIGSVKTSWATAGTVDVLLTAYNDDYPDGVVWTQVIEVLSMNSTSIYVSDDTGSDANDGLSWVAAKKTIQGGVDAQDYFGGMVWVSNGVYATGGGVYPGYVSSNRVVVTKDVRIRSENGLEHTCIVGASDSGSNGPAAVRGVHLSAGILSGFTITNGHTRISGDGYYDLSGGGVNMYGNGGAISNCVLVNNSAETKGGGSYRGTLDNCILVGNSAAGSYGKGGGSYGSTLNNCTLTNNTAKWAGGSYKGILNHCTLIGNSSISSGGMGGGSCYGTLNHCTLTDNSSAGHGGGSAYGELNHCTLSNNTAALNWSGGGSYYGTLNNCTFLSNSASYGGGSAYGNLISCTFTNNSTFGSVSSGGGSYFGTLINCTYYDNSSAGDGGGSSWSTLINCTLTGNSAFFDGGGSSEGTLINCTLTGNSASISGAGGGGGCSRSTLRNCIVYGNMGAGSYYNWNYLDDLSYCCTSPDPGGIGNITADPLFVHVTNGILRLQSASPCINAGHNSYVYTSVDLTNNPRVVGEVVDMGAYEHQDADRDADADGLEDLWEMTHRIGRHFAYPSAMSSNDVNTLLEAYIAGLNPNDPDAQFLLEGHGNEFWWNSVSGRVYDVWWSTNLMNGFQPLESNIPWSVGAFTDTVHTAEDKGFYQLKVELE